MNFIKVTLQAGGEVGLNPSHVESVEPLTTGCRVTMMSGKKHDLMESWKRITDTLSVGASQAP